MDVRVSAFHMTHYELGITKRYINPTKSCTVMLPTWGNIEAWSCIMSRGDIDCAQETPQHDGSVPYHVSREFHILMWDYFQNER